MMTTAGMAGTGELDPAFPAAPRPRRASGCRRGAAAAAELLAFPDATRARRRRPPRPGLHPAVAVPPRLLEFILTRESFRHPARASAAADPAVEALAGGVARTRIELGYGLGRGLAARPLSWAGLGGGAGPFRRRGGARGLAGVEDIALASAPPRRPRRPARGWARLTRRPAAIGPDSGSGSPHPARPRRASHRSRAGAASRWRASGPGGAPAREASLHGAGDPAPGASALRLLPVASAGI
jgi:hypothetical protein